MKVTVAQTFQDKITLQHHFAGEVIEIADKGRVSRLEELGLIHKVVEDKTTEPKQTTKRRKAGE